LGQRIESALPSAPLEIIGFENIPLVGEEFFAGEDLNLEEIRSKIKNKEETKKIDIKEGEDVLKIILKADEYASLEALEEVIIHSFKEDGKLAIIGKSVGNITEGDVKEASAFGAVIVVFKTKVDKAALILAKSHKVEIIESKIIYELEKTIEEKLKNKSPQEKRIIKILKCFGVKGKEQIVGGVVTKGYVKNQGNFEILRNDKKVGEGRILNLQSGKQDVKEAEEGKEVGLLLEAEEKIKEGDFLVF
jgi:translation initiation factor IF-2